MKPLLSVIFICSIIFLHAQYRSFEQTVQFIQRKVSCCSVPFSASTNRKADSIVITENGNITIGYSDNKSQLTFNLFELYKEKEGTTGIDTVMKGKFIQFDINAEKSKMIRFATAADARETYIAFLQLFVVCKMERKMFSDLNFRQTVDLINMKLAKWSEESGSNSVSAWQNGDISISNGRDQFFRFNLFELAGNDRNNKMDEHGIEIDPCDVKVHVPLAWIKFYTIKKQVGFIRLNCHTSPPELAIIRAAIIHMKSLCTKDDSFYNRAAMNFVGRNDTIKTENETLLASIRPNDKKDEGDTTITISSSGEGWMNKDSVPTGKWNFYAKDKEGKEYLFKSGTYQPTKAEMFEVINIDSSDLAKYGLSFFDLQRDRVYSVPFIKSYTWNYYHANGKLWKIVNYQVRQIPIYTSIAVDVTDPDGITKLLIALKENPDEWINTEVLEYSEEGKLYKKLTYYGFSEVYQKILYDNAGAIRKSENAKRYEKDVSPYNY